MNELERWATRTPRIMPSKEERAHSKAVANLVRETKLQGVKIDAEAALTGRIMERAVDIDNYRKTLAGDDPTLNAVLMRIELGFAAKAERIQRQFGSEFPL